MMNLWNATVPWYSLPFGVAGTTTKGTVRGGQASAAMIQLLEDLVSDHERIIYLSSSEASNFDLQHEGQWLKDHYSTVEEIHFKDDGYSKLLIISNSDLMK
jgi:hypothetical protein